MVVQDQLRLHEKIHEVCLEDVLSDSNISKPLFAESIGFYMANREPIIVEAFTNYNAAIQFTFPKKQIQFDAYKNTVTKMLEAMKNEVQNVNKVLEFRKEFPEPNVLFFGVHSRTSDLLFEALGIEEEDVASFNLQSPGISQKDRVEMIAKLEEFNDLFTNLRQLVGVQ